MVNFIDKLIEKLADWFMVFFSDPDYAMQPAFVSAASSGVNVGYDVHLQAELPIINPAVVKERLSELKARSAALCMFCFSVIVKAAALMYSKLNDSTIVDDIQHRALVVFNKSGSINSKISRISDAAGHAIKQVMRKPEHVMSVKHSIFTWYMNIPAINGLFLQGRST